jgi:hypothetical protein
MITFFLECECAMLNFCKIIQTTDYVNFHNTRYIDETYIHSSHTTGYECSDRSHKGLHKPIAKGKPLIIIVHAGNQTDFVENGLLIFTSGKSNPSKEKEVLIIARGFENPN